MPHSVTEKFFLKSKSACGMGDTAAAMFGTSYLLEIDCQVI